MERITEPEVEFTTDKIESLLHGFSVSQALKKLQAYEDSDLQPEMVARLAKMLTRGVIEIMDILPGDTVYEIKTRYIQTRHGRPKEYDHSICACPHRLKNNPDTCYVHKKICTKSDINNFGKSVFETQEDAEYMIEQAKKAKERMREKAMRDLDFDD